MHAYELFQCMGPDKAREILLYFRESERNFYKTAIATLAERKKLRPIFVLQKSVPEQIAWLIKELAQKKSDGAAEQLLQVWLLQSRQNLLVRFLDLMEIGHDGKGAVDELPEAMDAGKLAEAVDALSAEFDPLDVAIYLHVFNVQTPDGWPELAAALANDPRLKVGGAA